MKIYDEALNGLEAIRKELQDRLDFPINLTPEYRAVKKPLERAKKVEELLGLKNEMINAYQEYLASLHTIDRHMINKWKNEIFRLQDVIYTKEKELEELK